MSESFHVELGSPLPLSFTMPAAATGLFVRADVYDSVQSPVVGSPFAMTEVGATARYTAAGFTPLGVGSFTARFVAFTDAGFTIEALRFRRDQDSYIVDAAVWDRLKSAHVIPSSFGEAALIAAAAAGLDSILDLMVNDPDTNQLLSHRLRAFDSPTATSAATIDEPGGLELGELKRIEGPVGEEATFENANTAPLLKRLISLLRKRTS